MGIIKMRSAVLLLISGASAYHHHKNFLQIESFPVFKQWGLESSGGTKKEDSSLSQRSTPIQITEGSSRPLSADDLDHNTISTWRAGGSPDREFRHHRILREGCTTYDRALDKSDRFVYS